MKSSKFKPTQRTVKSITSLLFALSMVCTTVAFAQEPAWQLVKEEKDISVYTRAVEGSPFLAVKAVTIINTPINRVSGFMGTGDGCVEWRVMCKSSAIIETLSDSESWVHVVLDLPWPVADRDLVLHTKSNIDPESKTATITLQSDSERLPEMDDIRAESTGEFVIRVVGEQQIEFTYIMHTDLKGDLSANMINPRLPDAAFDDLARLRKLAEG